MFETAVAFVSDGSTYNEVKATIVYEMLFLSELPGVSMHESVWIVGIMTPILFE